MITLNPTHEKIARDLLTRFRACSIGYAGQDDGTLICIALRSMVHIEEERNRILKGEG